MLGGRASSSGSSSEADQSPRRSPETSSPRRPSPRRGYSSSAPGRNDSCYCGSGKKYKKCHLDLDRDTPRALVEVLPILEEKNQKARDTTNGCAKSSAYTSTTSRRSSGGAAR